MEAGDELGKRERLGHIVVASGTEPRYPIGQRVARRQEEHRCRDALCPKRLTDVAPICIRQPDVDDQDVRQLVVELVEEVGSGTDPGRVEPLFAKASQEDAAQVDVVLDDHHLRHGGRVLRQS